MKLILMFLLITIGAEAWAEESIVFVGKPSSRVLSNDGGADRAELDEQESAEYAVIIVKRDGKYYWRSREDKELAHINAGAMHFFVAPGSGYIKIMDTSSIAGLMDDELPSFMYFEHMSQMMTTITYHGVGGELTL